MPMLFKLGQQRALRAIAGQFEDGEWLFAFLDDLKLVGSAQLLPDSRGSARRKFGQCSTRLSEHLCFPKRPHVWGAVHLFPVHQGNTVRSVVSPLVVASFALPFTARRCRCGRLLDSYGHHRAACAVGVLGRRGFVLETAAARILSGSWWEGDDQHACA